MHLSHCQLAALQSICAHFKHLDKGSTYSGAGPTAQNLLLVPAQNLLLVQQRKAQRKEAAAENTSSRSLTCRSKHPMASCSALCMPLCRPPLPHSPCQARAKPVADRPQLPQRKTGHDRHSPV